MVSPKLTRDLPRPFKLVGNKRVDDTLQHKAVREALTNSIIHSDVFLSGGILRIEKHDDRLCFRNPGTLMLSIEDIYEGGYSKARNPKLQDMLRMIGYGENLGSGFPKILDAWKVAGWESPSLEDRLSTDEVILTLPVPFLPQDASNNFGKELAERQHTIMSLLRQKPSLNAKQIAEKISEKKPVSKRTIENDMIVLKQKGLIVREGGRKNGYWKLIY